MVEGAAGENKWEGINPAGQFRGPTCSKGLLSTLGGIVEICLRQGGCVPLRHTKEALRLLQLEVQITGLHTVYVVCGKHSHEMAVGPSGLVAWVGAGGIKSLYQSYREGENCFWNCCLGADRAKVVALLFLKRSRAKSAFSLKSREPLKGMSMRDARVLRRNIRIQSDAWEILKR